MAASRTQTAEETPLNRNTVGKGGTLGREVGTRKGDGWQRSWGGEQKGDKGQRTGQWGEMLRGNTYSADFQKCPG